MTVVVVTYFLNFSATKAKGIKTTKSFLLMQEYVSKVKLAEALSALTNIWFSVTV